MAKVRILRKDGSASPYFWSSKDTDDPASVTVYKRTTNGVKRMRGVRFNPVTNRMRKR